MASIEFIQKRIAGKKAEIEKLTKKLERIRKAEASGWENNPYYYHASDLKWTLRDIEEAKESLAKYMADLVTAQEKAASRNVPAITDFLERWKDHCREFYGDGLKKFFAEKQAVRSLYEKCCSLPYGSEEREAAEAEFKAVHESFFAKEYGYFETVTYKDRWGRTREDKKKVREGEYEYLRPYSGERTLEAAMEKLEKDLTAEANRKYDFIIERTNAIVGEITDAMGLKIGSKDDLNGYITGTRGTAKVKTIGAGGYNIQCFHFRTLINKA